MALFFRNNQRIEILELTCAHNCVDVYTKSVKMKVFVWVVVKPVCLAGQTSWQASLKRLRNVIIGDGVLLLESRSGCRCVCVCIPTSRCHGVREIFWKWYITGFVFFHVHDLQLSSSFSPAPNPAPFHISSPKDLLPRLKLSHSLYQRSHTSRSPAPETYTIRPYRTEDKVSVVLIIDVLN